MNKEIITFAFDNQDIIEHVDIKFKQGAMPKIYESSLWPQAVNKSLIVDENDDEQVKIRAQSIIKQFLPSLTDKKFLDFGAGTSGIAKHVDLARLGPVSIAYDLKESDGVTTDYEDVKKQGPYDVIMLYDVIDHMIDDDGNLMDWDGVVTKMNKIRKDLLAPKGQIFCRCHPWTARHGTHNYLLDNKSFGHYIHDKMGIPTIPLKEPVNRYKKIFKDSGLKISGSDIFSQPLQELFHDEIFDSWKYDIYTWKNAAIFREVMIINFIDYVIENVDA